MKKLFQKMALTFVMIILFCTFQCNAECCKIDFIGNATFDHSHIEPGTCAEHYDEGAYMVNPRHNSIDGTSPGKYYYKLSEDNGANWTSEAIEGVFSINCPQTKVAWKRGGADFGTTQGSGISYAFIKPRTAITYLAQFKSADAQHLERDLVGAETETGTSPGGNGVSVLTWEVTTPLETDPVGTLRAILENGIVKVKEKMEQPTLWAELYTLPKP